MRILVTGSAGFIGAHVVKELTARGDEVVGIDNYNDYYDQKLKRDRVNFLRPNIVEYEIDIADKEAVSKVFENHRFDAICHLAAQAGVRYSLENPDIYISANIIGTHNLLEQCRLHGIKKFIFASSSSVYGGNEKIPFSENDLVDKPVSLYAATKKANELEAHSYFHLYGINVVGLRFFTVYGPWGRPDMALFKFVKAILKGDAIDVYNQGEMKRDFTYIDDIVSGVLASIDYCQGYEIFNLGNNNPVDLKDFISVIEEALGIHAVRNYLPLQPGDVVKTYANIDKAKSILEWTPKTDIRSGIERFVEWYKSYYKV
jgi:UDP-glucuronate 4-epimerase